MVNAPSSTTGGQHVLTFEDTDTEATALYEKIKKFMNSKVSNWQKVAQISDSVSDKQCNLYNMTLVTEQSHFREEIHL